MVRKVKGEGILGVVCICLIMLGTASLVLCQLGWLVHTKKANFLFFHNFLLMGGGAVTFLDAHGV